MRRQGQSDRKAGRRAEGGGSWRGWAGCVDRDMARVRVIRGMAAKPVPYPKPLTILPSPDRCSLCWGADDAPRQRDLVLNPKP